MLPTPSVMDSGGFCGKPDKGRKGPTSGRTLTGKVLEIAGRGPHAKWPTPRADERCQYNSQDNGIALSRAVKWPSPRVSTGDYTRDRGDPNKPRLSLEGLVKQYPTPRKSDCNGAGWHGDGGLDLRTCVSLPVIDSHGALAPDWVEWLMGWPWGWTSLDELYGMYFMPWSHDPAETGQLRRLTTDKSHRRQRIMALGNGQVPLAFATAWRIMEAHD